MPQKIPLIIRQSRITVLIALFLCMLLLVIGSLDLRGSSNFSALGFLILVTCFILFVLWNASFITIFTSTSLQSKSFDPRWHCFWEQVKSWGLEFSGNGDYSIWFKTHEAIQRRYIQAVGEDQAGDVKAYFEHYCGSPQMEDFHSVQPTPLNKKEGNYE